MTTEQVSLFLYQYTSSCVYTHVHLLNAGEVVFGQGSFSAHVDGGTRKQQLDCQWTGVDEIAADWKWHVKPGS